MPKENNVPLRIHFIQIICIIMFFVPMLVKKKILLKKKRKTFFYANICSILFFVVYEHLKIKISLKEDYILNKMIL